MCQNAMNLIIDDMNFLFFPPFGEEEDTIFFLFWGMGVGERGAGVVSRSMLAVFICPALWILRKFQIIVKSSDS